MNLLGLGSHGLEPFEQVALIGVVITAIISLVYAWLLRNNVMKKDKGTAKMQEVWNAIRIGADSYLNPEGQPTARPLPEFTMRQSGVRGGRLIDKEARGDQRAGRAAGSQSRPRSERPASRPEHRHGHGRPGASHGPHFERPHGHGRGGGHARPGRGGKKRSR